MKKLREDEKYRYEFFSHKDPAEFLKSEADITIPEDQKKEFNAHINSRRDRYGKSSFRSRSESDRDIYEIAVEMEPPG